MQAIFYEDNRFADYYPLSLSRPVYMLLIGTSKIYKKWLAALKIDDHSFLSRQYLAEIISLETGKKTNDVRSSDALLINGSFLPSPEIASQIGSLGEGEGLFSDDVLVAGRIKGKSISRLKDSDDPLSAIDEEIVPSLKPAMKVKAVRLAYLWDFVNRNGEVLEKEFAPFKSKWSALKRKLKGVDLINPEMIAIADNATIMPSVVIDASSGPVIIDRDVVVEPFTYIQGPGYIGPDCRLVGGRIREGCSFGPVCRVGGEVEETIMIGYSNKYHEGFLGHACLGEWINLGALTTNSDLKNNYTNISVQLPDEKVDTGSIKVGCFIGDHTKTGIGTMLNTGISIGFSCNLYGSALFTDRRISSFSWGVPGHLINYRLDKAIETATASMSRRGVEFAEAHQRLFAKIAEIDGKR